MAVALDALSSAATKGFTLSTLDNGNLTVGAGANMALIAIVSGTNNGSTISAAWDVAGANQTMTSLADIAISGGSWSSRAAIFGLRAPATGNKICTASFAGPTTDNGLLYLMSFSGVHQASDATAFPTAGRQSFSETLTGGSGGGTLTLTIPSAVGNVVASVLSEHWGPPTADTLTNVVNDFENTVRIWGLWGASTSSSMVVTNTIPDPGGGNGDPLTVVGVDIAAADGGGGSGAGGLLLFGGSVGWTPALLGASAWKAGEAIRRNATLGRRRLLLGKW